MAFTTLTSSAYTTLDATKLTGNLPSISGASLTGLKAGSAGFAARSTTLWATLTQNQLVAFNNDSTGDSFDTDSCYNTSTYKFTAPATGLYMFWYSIYTAQNDASNGFGFLLNGNALNFQQDSFNILSYGESSTDDHNQTATIIVPVSSGHEVAVASMTSSDYYGHHSQWGGCRLA